LVGLSRFEAGVSGLFRTLARLSGAIALTAGIWAGAAHAETRTLKLYYVHTGERADIVFKRNGRYDEAGLKKINHFLRDWRRNEPTKMDPRLLDLVWEVYRQSGSRQHIHIISAYRSPATNSMLRSRGRGVAKNSQHTLGKAMDFFLPDVKLSKLREIGLRMEVGGVGFYPTSGSPFVHLDTGSVRHWPKMSRQELARVFPNGRTIHIPSDGKPMPGYQQALASYKARGNAVPTSAASGEEEESEPNFFQRLATRFRDQNGEEKKPAEQPAVAAAEETQVAEAAADPIDQPRTEASAGQVVLASIPVPTPAPRRGVTGGEAIEVAEELPVVEPQDTSAEPQFEVAFAPVPVKRPDAAFAFARNNQASGATFQTAALTADEIEELRRSAQPVDSSPQLAAGETEAAIQSATADGEPIPFRVQSPQEAEAALALAEGSPAERAVFATAMSTAVPSLRPSTAALEGAQAKPAPSGPSDRTLRLALAPEAVSRNTAIEAIRGLIEAGSSIEVPATLTGSINVASAVPSSNPRKHTNASAQSDQIASIQGMLQAERATDFRLIAEKSSFRRPDFTASNVTSRPDQVLVAGFVKDSVLQPMGRMEPSRAARPGFTRLR
jgi:uncharacterized protein YcbK (DUF882 family)